MTPRERVRIAMEGGKPDRVPVVPIYDVGYLMRAIGRDPREWAVAGTADKVTEFLLREVKAGGLNYLLCRFAFGDITGAESLHSLDLFVRRVMPALTAHEGNA